MTKYIALIRKEAETDYWVDIPDLPGCISSGESEDEALASFQDAIEFHIEAMKENGAPIPSPRTKEEVLGEEEESDYLKACWVEVPV